MHDLVSCWLIAVLAFIFGMVAALLVKTMRMETREHERDDAL